MAAFAFPCLLLGYIGQAAYIAKIPSALVEPVLQDSASRMLLAQPYHRNSCSYCGLSSYDHRLFPAPLADHEIVIFPQIKVIHTSKIYYGQLYIPWANWLLMIGTVIVTAVYNNTTKLGHAYGVCVILVTFITTNMVALVALLVWRVPIYIVIPIWLCLRRA